MVNCHASTQWQGVETFEICFNPELSNQIMKAKSIWAFTAPF